LGRSTRVDLNKSSDCTRVDIQPEREILNLNGGLDKKTPPNWCSDEIVHLLKTRCQGQIPAYNVVELSKSFNSMIKLSDARAIASKSS
jgi:hypothetical protein